MNRKTKIMLAILVLSINISILTAGIIKLDARSTDDEPLATSNYSSKTVIDSNTDVHYTATNIDFNFCSGLPLNNPCYRDSLVPYPNNHTTG